MKKLALASLCVLSFSAHAAEREWIPYKKLVEQLRLDKFYALPAAERDKVNLFVTVRPADKSIKPSDVALTVVHGAERQPLPLSPDYRMTVVPNARWLADDAVIMTNLGKDQKSKLGWDITVNLPEGQQWKYAAVMDSVGQTNQAIRKMAGALSMFAPSVKLVVFKFARPAQLKIESAGGARVYASDARGQIRLKPDAALLKENPAITASERPFEAELDAE